MARPIVNGPANRGLPREPPKLSPVGSSPWTASLFSSMPGTCLHKGPKNCPAQGSRAAKPKRLEHRHSRIDARASSRVDRAVRQARPGPTRLANEQHPAVSIPRPWHQQRHIADALLRLLRLALSQLRPSHSPYRSRTVADLSSGAPKPFTRQWLHGGSPPMASRASPGLSERSIPSLRASIFAAAAEPSSTRSYLKRVAFHAAYRTQLFSRQAFLLAPTEHGVPLASSLGEELEARSPGLGRGNPGASGPPDFDDRHRPGEPATGGTRCGPADWLFCLARSVSSRALPQSPLWRNGLGGFAV